MIEGLELILVTDYTLGHFLRGVVQFTARYQPPEASELAKTKSKGEAIDEEIDAGAERDFNLVLEHAPKVEVCRHIPTTELTAAGHI